jgi:hypothetical protein
MPNKNTIHGHCIGGTETPTHKAWHSMKQRCYNKQNPKYPRYGQRGIVVCEEWINSFVNFVRDMGVKPKGMTLERRDVNGNYCALNCIWASAKIQANNKTNNRVIEFEGKRLTTALWAEDKHISFVALRMRLHRNWPIEKALNKPLRIWA